MCNSENHDFYNWFAGFVDGEGHFGIYRQRGRKTTFTSHTKFQFRIKLRDDDVAILEEIKNRLGFGNVYKVAINECRAALKNSKPQAAFQTCSIRDSIKLVKILDEHGMRSKKRRDYEIWRRAVLLCEDIHSSVYENFENLSEELSSVRKYSHTVGA